MTTIVEPNPVGVVDPTRVRWRPPKLTPSLISKTVFGVVVLGGLVYFVGGQVLVETAIKVAIAVGISAGLFIFANKLFDLAYPKWAVFSGVAGAGMGFIAFLLLDGNRALRELPARPWLWALIGAVALGAAGLVLNAPSTIAWKLPLSVVSFAALGVLIGVAMNDSVLPEIDWGRFVLLTAIGIAVAVGWRAWRSKGDARQLPRAALMGAAVGAALGGWGCADLGAGTTAQAIVASVVPLTLLGIRVGLQPAPTAAVRREVEQRSRSWIFLIPAIFFVVAGLVVPLIRTIYLSFHDRDGVEYVGMDNFKRVFDDKGFWNTSRWGWDAFLYSKLFWTAAALIGLGVIAGVVSGRRTRRAFDSSGGAFGPLMFGFFLLACSVLATLRGTLFNNIWWVIVVTALATSIGLAVAVLADRSRGENVAKSLIFLPMAISFIGAGIIWRFMYQPRNKTKPQTGVLNALWVWLGDVSNTGWKTAVAVILLLGVFSLLILFAVTGIRDNVRTRTGISVVGAIIVVYLIYRFLGPGVGGFVENPSTGAIEANPINFIQEPPFNNMWLMVVLIWIQTGFATVIFSAAIKAVPSELTEAARIDGANESQVFWKVTIPQIAPTIGVVVTTLTVTVLKIFDIVKVMTNGNFDTQTIANDMFTRAFSNNDSALGSALATVLFVGVLPIMYVNIRRMQRSRG